MPRLVVLHGPDSGRRFELADGIAVVGRHSANPVPLTDPRVSRRHCEVRVVGTRVQLADLGSGNGTGVNGSPVQTADLRTGDRIQVGDTLLEFSADSSTQSAATRPEPEGARVVVRPEHPSAILRSVPADAAGRLLARPDLAESDWLRSRLANLAVLYEASNAISEIPDVDQLLERIVDLVRTATDADHGCALLLDRDTGGLVPKAVRSKRRTGGEIVVSRTVTDHVLRENHGVLVGDAAADERFRDRASVVQHRLREVICVPMAGRRETVGVLFLDTSSPADDSTLPGRPAKFTEDHLRLAVAVGHQAALAVEESRYYQALIRAERLAAVGQTIAGLSHHIKNVMQGVRFGGDMVRMALADGDGELLGKGWKLVEKSQRRIDDLILDMLNFAKEREPSSEPTDLNSVAGEAVETVRGRAADTGVTITLVRDEALPPVPCDPDGLLRAVLNVATNAVDAAGGSANGTVTVTVARAGEFAEVRVADSGPGVPPDRIEDIFKPFVSTKGARGTGLGLPAARKTLHEHGGDVTVANAATGGAVFTLRLPLAATGPVLASASTFLPPPLSKGGPGGVDAIPSTPPAPPLERGGEETALPPP